MMEGRHARICFVHQFIEQAKRKQEQQEANSREAKKRLAQMVGMPHLLLGPLRDAHSEKWKPTSGNRQASTRTLADSIKDKKPQKKQRDQPAIGGAMGESGRAATAGETAQNLNDSNLRKRW